MSSSWSLFKRLTHRTSLRLYRGWHDPSKITMGRFTYGDPTTIVYSDRSAGRVDIGSFCSIASGVRFILDGAHRADFITTSPFHGLGVGLPEGHGASKGPITVGHDVWIGRDATVLSGVAIGTGAVIGACSVVGSDVRPYAIAAGNPAREVGRRFGDSECDALLASKWWEWPDDRIRQAVDDLRSSDVHGFMERWTT